MGSCSSNLPILQAVSTIQEPVEKKNAVKVGMDEANKKGLEVLITEGPEAMFAHMMKESGGDYYRMMAMYH